MNRDEYYAALYANRAYVEEHKDELMHYGVKGQQWGVRQYQNPDGTLTELGRIHYKRELQRHTDAKVAYETAADDVATRRPWSAVGGGLAGGYSGAIVGIGAGGVAGSAGLGAAVGGIGGAAVGALLGLGVSKLSERIYRKNSDKAQAKVDELVRQYGDLELNSEQFTSLTKKALEKGQAAKSNNQPTMRRSENNSNKYDLEFLERIDNPQYGELSDASLNKIYKEYKSGASWDTLYDMKNRYEKLDNK